MLTIDDIRSVPLFSTLGQSELERLAQTSADLHLGAGQFAVNEGGDRALYAVLAGRIEVVKVVDGVERRLGWRVPGNIFGEVPIALGTPFPGGLPGVRAFARHPRRRAPVLRSCGRLAEGLRNDWRARTRAHRRIAGHRCGSAEGARARRRPSLGQRLQRDPPVSRRATT